MARRERVEVRHSQPFHLTVAALGVSLVGAVGLWVLFADAGPSGEKFEHGRLLLLGLCGVALLYYSGRSVWMLLDRRPHLVIDRDGIWYGFGRELLVPWSDVQWARRRGVRGTLMVGVPVELYLQFRLSLWNLDDSLTAVPGAGNAVGLRGNGLDRSTRDILDAIFAWKPELGRPLR